MMRARIYAVLLLAGFAAGYMIALPGPVPKPPLTQNIEQNTRMVASLTDWLEHHDPEATGYDFPNPIGCQIPSQPWLHDGLACTFGVTYIDETTRRYTVVMDVHNTPLHIYRTARTVAVPDPP